MIAPDAPVRPAHPPASVNRLAFTEMRSAFERALERVAPTTCDLTLADRSVRLQVAGPRLFERLYPAFSQLRTRAAAAVETVDLTISLWDVAATGVAPPLPATESDPGANGAVLVSADGRIVVYRRQTSSAWLDRDAAQLVGCFTSASQTSLYDRSKPLQLPLAVWHLDCGVPLVHAGVVGRAGRGILLPGKGGSGKSTAAVCCALAGFDYVGDDCVGLERGSDGQLRAHGVYASTSLEPQQLARFPSLAPHALAGSLAQEDKHVVLLDALWPNTLSRVVTLSAIAIPRIVPGRDSRLVAASRAEALRALAPSTMLFFPGWGAKQLEFLAAVIAKLPCYRLEMGEDLSQIPACLEPLVV